MGEDNTNQNDFNAIFPDQESLKDWNRWKSVVIPTSNKNIDVSELSEPILRKLIDIAKIDPPNEETAGIFQALNHIFKWSHCRAPKFERISRDDVALIFCWAHEDLIPISDEDFSRETLNIETGKVTVQESSPLSIKAYSRLSEAYKTAIYNWEGNALEFTWLAITHWTDYSYRPPKENFALNCLNDTGNIIDIFAFNGLKEAIIWSQSGFSNVVPEFSQSSVIVEEDASPVFLMSWSDFLERQGRFNVSSKQEPNLTVSLMVNPSASNQTASVSGVSGGHMFENFKQCCDNYGEDGDSEWSNNIISKYAIQGPSGRIGRPGFVEFLPPKDVLQTCIGLSSAAAEIMKDVELGFGSESGDGFDPFYVVAGNGWALSSFDESNIRSIFGDTLWPKAKIKIEPLSETAPWFEDIIEFEYESPETGKAWRNLLAWFEGQNCFTNRAMIFIDKGDCDVEGTEGGCVFPVMALGRLIDGSISGLFGAKVWTYS